MGQRKFLKTKTPAVIPVPLSLPQKSLLQQFREIAPTVRHNIE